MNTPSPQDVIQAMKDSMDNPLLEMFVSSGKAFQLVIRVEPSGKTSSKVTVELGSGKE
jgi:hypothetical protein